MAAPLIRFKRGQFVNLPDLLPGEPGFTTDFYDFYIGTAGIGTATNQFFGSGRYWERETNSTSAKLKLFGPSSGTNSLTFEAPNPISGVGTYIFPDTTDGQAGDSLTITGVSNGVYTLEWSNATAGAVSGITLRDEGAAAPPEGASGIGSVTTVDVVGTGVTALFDNSGLSGVGTIRVYTATETQEGTARFSSADFTVTSGLVELASDITFTDATFTTINVTGVSTFTQVDATTIDTTNINVTGISTLNNVTVGGALTVTGLTDLNGGLDVTGSTVLNNNLSVSGISTFTGLIDGNGGLDITGQSTFTDINVTGITTTVTLNVTGNSTIGDAGGDTLTVNATATFNQPIVGSISTATRSTTVDTTLTTANAEYYPVFVDTNGSATGETIRVDSDGLTYNPSTNVLTVPTIDVTSIRHTNDTVALTIDTSGNVVASQNFTVSGNLFVNGNTTQINTTELTVYDRTITLGVQTGGTPGTTTWDLGILMNYGDVGVAKTAGLIWEYSTERFQFSANSNNPSSSDSNTPQITVSAFAPIEIGSLWLNDTKGQEEVISYLASDTLYVGQPAGRYLQNITVDAGEF